MQTKKIIFKIGGDMLEDIREVFKNPKQVKGNTHTVYLKTVDDLPKMLTPEKLKMLITLAEDIGYCPDVKGLSHTLNRKREAISRDLASLEKNGLITKTKKGKNVYPKLNAKEIVIQLA